MSIRTNVTMGVLVLTVGLAGAAKAADGAGRYSMSPTDGGFVRLDTQTGAMALCTGKEGAWSCSDIAETAGSTRARLQELERENSALRDEVKRLEEGGLAEPAPPKALSMPDEKDVDRAFDYVESMVRKFRERIRKLEEQENSGGGTPL